ncbi:MAG: aldo/keto reductase [Saprospiraceae bacterium]
MKELVLGTAQFAWTIERAQAFALLDVWLSEGHRRIDCATNYPINKNPADFRAAESILREYCVAHGLRDLKITMKVGSLNNLRTPDAALSPSFLYMMADEYRNLFGDNLHTLMLHWDHREDAAEIADTVEALRSIGEDYGLQAGLSGIARPDLYAAANADMGLYFELQLKHNVFHSDLPRYAPLREYVRTFAYGLNAGGVKLDGANNPNSTLAARGGSAASFEPQLAYIRQRMENWTRDFVRPPVRDMNQIGLLYAALHPDLYGMLLGPSSSAQLRRSLEWLRDVETFDYADVYRDLRKVADVSGA